MNDRTKKLEAVFHAAMDLASAEERERYLSQACAGDPELRREVDDLLNSAEAADAVFQAGREACRVPEAVPAAILTEKPGARIGRYKLLEKMGEGGMGVVYMAEQEQPVRRKVALKIIKLGMDTRQVVARFEAERQALAMMDHPHIAKVLDAGATETGRPYFVMELVQGVPITQFCDANKLSTTERLKLFSLACQAIQSAHQKGIIHRDIKPSNVLVTLNAGVPHPMVIDFGVAKATNQKLTEKTLFTNFATMIGTPAYMSPEQAEMSKLDVDTRSDIYSLGVLLYELLTGTTPFPEERLRSVAYGEMQRIIAEEEPERPSTRLRKKVAGTATSLVTRHSSLATDLDWLVMKCLEKDRNRRYETANGLAADIQRHLTSEPVLARPPSRLYEFQKTVRRHKVGFAAAATVLLALASGVAVSTWQAVRATRAEQAARAVKKFLLDQTLAANPYVEPVPDPARGALLERMAREVDLKFTNQPLIEAELRMILGNGFSALGDYANGLIQSQKALEIRQRTLGPHHSDTLWSLSWVVQGQMGYGRKIQGRDLLENAFHEIKKKSLHSLSSGEAEVVWTYGDLLCNEDGDPAKGLPYLEEGLAAFRRTVNHRDHILQNKLNMLARATEAAGNFDDAERLRREGMQQAEREFGADHILVAQFKKGLAGFLRRRGRGMEEALLLIEFAAPIYCHVLGTNHQMTVDAEMLQAEILDQLKRTEEAGELYATLYQRWLRLFPNSPDARDDKCRKIAQFFVRERRYEEAKATFEALSGSFEAHPPKNVGEFEMFIQTTGATKGWLAAATAGRMCFDAFAKIPTACRTMGTVFLYVGQEEEYRELTTKAIALTPATTNWEAQLAILYIVARGPFNFSADQKQKCKALIQSVERAIPSVASAQQARAYRAIGALELRLGEPTNALAHLETVPQMAKEPAGRARTLLIKALCLHRLGRIEESRATFAEAEAILKPALLDRLSEFEGFLSDADRYDILLHREAQALIGLK